MSRPKNDTPAYSLHPASGQARVRINKKDFYLGLHGTPASKEKYAQLLAEHFQPKGLKDEFQPLGQGTLTISELVLRYDTFARSFYVKDGERTDERYRAFIEPLVRLYGSTAAKEFGPLRFQAVREMIVARGNVRSAEYDDDGRLVKPGQPLVREYINSLMGSLIRMFKWAVAQELVPVSVHKALLRVPAGLPALAQWRKVQRRR